MSVARMKQLMKVAIALALSLPLTGCLIFALTGNYDPESTSVIIGVSSGNLEQCQQNLASQSLTCTYSPSTDPEHVVTSEAMLSNFDALVLFAIDPLIVELPAGAHGISGTFSTSTGTSGNLLITAGLTSVPIDLTHQLAAEPGTQLVIVDIPTPTSTGNYNFGLTFTLPAGSTNVGVKVVFAAKVQLGAQTFYPPMLPCATDFASVPVVAIPASATPQPLLMPSLTGCTNKVYNFGSGPAGGAATVPTLGPATLSMLIGFVALVAAGVLSKRRRKC